MWRAPEQEARLAAAWRDAKPFPHVVIDDVLPADALAELMAILDEEPVHTFENDLYQFDATAPEPTTPELRAVRDELARVWCPVLARITGHATTRIDLRAFAYRPGHYLLPHTDCQDDLPRVLAYAYYLPTPEPPTGGELELMPDGIVIEPRPNRIAIFEVSPRSLHRVHEVLAGLRLSLAGWFYP